MFIILYSAVLLLVLILSKRQYGKYLSFPVVFSTAWLLFAALSSIGLFGMRKPSLIVHLCVIMFVLTVDVCFLIKYPQVKFIHSNSVSNNTTYRYVFCSNRFLPMEIIAVILASPLILNTITSYLSGNDISTVRLNYFGQTLSGNPILNLLFKEVPFGIFHALVIVFSMYAFTSGVKKYLFIAAFNVFVITFVNGGRIGIFNFFITLFLVYLYQKDNIILGFKFTKKVKKLLRILIFAALAVSILRGQNFFKDIIAYFTGSFAFWDYIIQDFEAFNLNDHLYGQMTFGVIVEPIILVLKYLGLTSAKVPSYHFNYYCQNYFNIGNGAEQVFINNNTTCFYFFYKDFGYIGILIGAVILGTLTSISLRKWVKEKNILSGLLFIFLALTLIDGIITYRVGTTPMFILCTMLLSVRKKGVMNNI